MKIKKTGQAGRSRSKDEWIYGLNPVLEAIRSGREIKSVIISSSRKEKTSVIDNEVTLRGIELRREDNLFFDSRFPKGHQGVAAMVSPRKYSDIDYMLKIPDKRGESPLFLILDCIEDPRNFGAILRAADAGGVHGVVKQPHRSASLGPEAVKASAGASEHISIAMVPNIKHAIKQMREIGLTVIGAEAGSGKTIWDIDLDVPLALVIGSESRGLRKTVREDCDILVSLPMKGRVNSLNVSVAAGIMLFEIMRQREQKKQLA